MGTILQRSVAGSKMEAAASFDDAALASCLLRDGYFISERVVPEVICTVGCGGIVAMCPLILHASAAAETVGHRRVIHIEFAAADLYPGLEWNNRVGTDANFGIGGCDA